MNFDNYYTTGSSFSSTPSMTGAAMIWMIVAFVLALIGCFVVYFLFVKKEGKPAQKFLAWLKEFLRFDTMLIEPILKIAYIFAALFITLSSFSFISVSFLTFLLYLVLGNLITRVVYEGLLMWVMVWKNTTEIKNKLK